MLLARPVFICRGRAPAAACYAITAMSRPVRFHRPANLPPLHPRAMMDDGRAYIGSSLHNRVMTWLFSMLRSIETSGAVHWHVRGLLSMDIPWEDGRSERLFADLALYSSPIDPNAAVIDLGVASPPVLVLEIADIASAQEMAADADLTEAKAARYAAIGVRDYLVYDLEAARQGAGMPIWARRRADGGTEAAPWEEWEPDERGVWVSARAGVGFSLAGHGDSASLRLWGPDGRPYLTDSEQLEEARRRGVEIRSAVAEAQLTLLRARYKRDMS